VRLHGFNSVTLGVLVLSVITLSGCADLAVRDTASLLVPRFQRSEILGFVAGFGTTFAGCVANSVQRVAGNFVSW
jgi:hypothetical protein